jgi:hypothetical protein
MKRTAWPRASSNTAKSLSDRDARLDARAHAAIKSVVPRAAVMMGCSAGIPMRKEPAPLRSDQYRRAVASLPCAHCGIAGYSQHAHENDGKAKGTKLDDRRAMPLCCTRPGIEGCHAAFDQYRLIPGGRHAHIELGRAMAAQTRQLLNTLGLWPARIPQYPTDEAS